MIITAEMMDQLVQIVMMIVVPPLLWIVLPGLAVEKLLRIKGSGGIGAAIGLYALVTYGPWAQGNIFNL